MSLVTRQRMSNGLLGVAILGGIASFILGLLLLIAGTALVGHDAAGRSSNVMMKDLAFVSFDGIIADNETSSFLVHIHWFASSFAWEYPNAPSTLPAAGFATRGPRTSSDLLDELHTIATTLDVPRNTWDCPSPGPFVEPCSNLFFEAWRSSFYMPLGGLTQLLSWIMLFSAVVIATVTVLQEWVIKRKPHWMKCRCIVLKKHCPYPTGTKEEIEALDEHAWDKVRLSYWGLVMLYFLAPVLHGTFAIHFFKRYLDHFNRRLPEGFDMNVRQGAAVESAIWGAFGASVVSFLCILVRWWMSRRARGWMDQQALGELPVEPEESNGPASEDDAPNYTD